ncbi:MAG: VanZ family protein [Candidatus Electrothrix communis]|nr:MAG: VanZ family protein [Candidatus Electrothrix communis]
MSSFLFFIRKYWVAWTIIILVAITGLSLWPNKSLPSVPGGDKIHHLIAYAALVFPVALRRPKSWYLIVVLFIAFSGLIELIQPFVYRYGEWLDLAANIIGLACGILFAEAVRRWEAVTKREEFSADK